MTTVLFRNGAVGTLATAILTTDTTWQLTPGHGARFPDPQADEYCVLTCQSGADVEIVHLTARVADTLTVIRAREDTAPLPFPIGAVVDLRVTAGLLDTFMQYAAGGTLTLAGITFTKDTDILRGGTLQDNKIRGADIKLSTLAIDEVKPADGNQTRSIRLPNAAGRPTIGAATSNFNSEILTEERLGERNLTIRGLAPTVFLIDTDGAPNGQHGAALICNDNWARLLRLSTTGTVEPFANGQHPLSINLDTGDVYINGITFQADGNIWSQQLGFFNQAFDKYNAFDARITAMEASLNNAVASLNNTVASLTARLARAESLLGL